MTDLILFEGSASVLKKEVSVKSISERINHVGPKNSKIKDTGNYGLYYDSLGKLTGCIGHLIVDNKSQFRCTNPKTEEALKLLEEDVEKHNQYTLNVLKQHKIDVTKLPENVLVSLLHLGFNIGPTSLNGFKNTLSEIRKGNYHKAAENLLKSKWAGQVGLRRSNYIFYMLKGDDYE